MANKITVCLEIGSECVSLICGSNGVNNSFNIVSFESAKYDGFLNGEFLNPTSLKFAISDLVTKLENQTHKVIDSCFVGVPSEFCLVETGEATLSFERPKRINDDTLEDFCVQAALRCRDNKDYRLINKAPIYFACEDGMRVFNPRGRKATKLTGEISFVFAKNEFIKTISSILVNVGIIKFNFLSEPLSTGLYLLGRDIRETGAILVDCGYITTGVSFVMGDGLKALKAFSLGGGNIMTDLSEVLKIKYTDAEKLKRSMVLSLEPTETEVYSIETSSGAKAINARTANEIAEKRIEQIASYITKCINSFDNVDPQAPVYLTGGALTKLKGSKDLLSKLIARKIIVAKGTSLEYREPDSAAAIALLNFANLIYEGV